MVDKNDNTVDDCDDDKDVGDQQSIDGADNPSNDEGGDDEEHRDDDAEYSVDDEFAEDDGDPYSDLSAEEIAYELAQLNKMSRDCQDIIDTYDDQTRKWQREKGGERLDILLSNQDDTLRALQDPNPDIRELALQLTYRHWNVGMSLTEIYERMALSDPVVEVRNMAINALSVCYRGTQHRQVGAFFANIVCDTDRSLEERKIAYLSLVAVEGDFQRFSVPTIIQQFPAVIDWDFVANYTRNSR